MTSPEKGEFENLQNQVGGKNPNPSEVPSIFRGLNPAFYQGVSGFFGNIGSIFTKAKNIAKPTKANEKQSAKTQKVQIAELQKPQQTKTVSSVSTAKLSVVRKVMKLVFFILLLILLALGGLYVNSRLNINGGGGMGGIFGGKTETPTPTPVVKPEESIYAKDESILQLEEDVKALDAELRRTSLKETTLTPPNLDYNVKF